MQKLLIPILFISLVFSQTVPFPVLIRDFKVTNTDNPFPSFMQRGGDDRGNARDFLDANREPVYAKTGPSVTTGGADDFHRIWYGGADNCFITEFYISLPFTKTGNTYTYESSSFFPIDGQGFGNTGYAPPNDHNYHFSVQIHTQFTYSGGETFSFTGDDDVYVFINNKLALDLGGIHGPESGSFQLDNLKTSHNISTGGTYNFDFFFAERCCCGSNIKITTTIPIVPPPNPDCTNDTDGDGVVNCKDNCKTVYNPDQRDCNWNGKGDACDDQGSTVSYPYVAQFEYHYVIPDTTKAFVFGSSTQFDTLSSATPKDIVFNDPIPQNLIPNYQLELLAHVKNLGTVNCPITLQVKSATGNSDVLYALVTPGNFTVIRSWALDYTFYNFAFPPIGGTRLGAKSASGGSNTLTITSSNAACNGGNLQVGSVILTTRYARQTNDVTDYYFNCTLPTDCKYGTYRFGGYCACWSGAWGRSCTMETAVPGTSTFPDIESKIVGAWDPLQNGRGANNASVYFGLDLNTMQTRDFFRNFTGHPTCPYGQWQLVYDLETGGVVQMDSAGFENQNLVILISQPFVDGRADGAVFLNDDTNSILNFPDCVYPISPYISKQVAKCRDVWRFQIPWPKAKTCLWTVKDEDSYQVYTGKVIVHNQEYVGTEEWRIIRSILRVKVRFQRYVTVETSDQNFSNDRMQKFAITKQIVALELGQPSLIEIGTLLQWPFELYNFTFSKYPTEKIARSDLFYDGCTSQYGQQCRQYYRSSLYLTEGTCTLDGDYEFTFDVNCDEKNLANCTLSPSNPNDYILKVQFKLKSENFCATISVDIGIIGKIGSYDNQSFVGSKSNFIIGRRVYYLVKVNSDLNDPKVNGVVDIEAYDTSAPGTIIKFTKTELVTVQIKLANQTRIKIWENKATVGSARFLSVYGIDFKTDCQSHTQSTNPTATLKTNAIGFSFVMTREVASPPKAGKVTITVLAEVQVTYPKQGAKKRVDDSDSGTEYAATTDIEDDSPITDTTTSTGATDTVTTTGATTGTDTTPTSATTATTTTASTTTTNVQPSDSSNALALFVTLMMLIATLI